MRGLYEAALYREGRLHRWRSGANAITEAGKDHFLGVIFKGDTPSATWYIGLISASEKPYLLDPDDQDDHPGWVEIIHNVYGGSRCEWVEGAAVNGVITSSAQATFTFTTAERVGGILIINESANPLGVIWATATFNDPIPVANGDVLKVRYTIDLNDGSTQQSS